MWEDINDPYEKFAHDDTTFKKFKNLFNHHIENLDRDLVGTEELKSRLRKQADLEKQKNMIKTKNQLESKRRKALKQVTPERKKLNLLPIMQRHNRNGKIVSQPVSRSKMYKIESIKEAPYDNIQTSSAQNFVGRLEASDSSEFDVIANANLSNRGQ